MGARDTVAAGSQLMAVMHSSLDNRKAASLDGFVESTGQH